jgi:hypothetical protein
MHPYSLSYFPHAEGKVHGSTKPLNFLSLADRLGPFPSTRPKDAFFHANGERTEEINPTATFTGK